MSKISEKLEKIGKNWKNGSLEQFVLEKKCKMLGALID